MVVLSLTGVSRRYDMAGTSFAALDKVNLSIEQGEFVAITGQSGSGKSTLLQIAGLLDRPTEGVVEVAQWDTAALSDAERTALRLRTIGFVFQRFHLLGGLTALENVVLPLEAAGVPLAERRARAAALLRRVGLGARLQHRPSQLSGGQRQRVAVARALANDPPLVFADEPTGQLHTDDKWTVLELLQQMHADGRTVVVVTQR